MAGLNQTIALEFLLSFNLDVVSSKLAADNIAVNIVFKDLSSIVIADPIAAAVPIK